MVLGLPIRHTHDMRRAAIATLHQLKSPVVDASSLFAEAGIELQSLDRQTQSAMGGPDEHDFYLVSP
jgi:hypothetical protein